MVVHLMVYCFYFFFFNDTSTTEIYTYIHTLSLHDALPISQGRHEKPIGIICTYAAQRDLIKRRLVASGLDTLIRDACKVDTVDSYQGRSEEHTSELQSLMRISYAVFCLKKKNTFNRTKTYEILTTNIQQYILHCLM